MGGVIRPDIAGIVWRMWRMAGVRPWHVVLPMVMAILISLAEGGSFAFLIPLSDGVAAGSFAFLDDSERFRWVTALVPSAIMLPERRDIALAVVLLCLLLVGRLIKVALELLRTWWVTSRDQRLLTRVGRETFRRLTGFGSLYFQRRPLGHIDTELTWAASPIQVLSQLESIVMHLVRLSVKLTLVLAISVHLFLSLVVSLVVLAGLIHLVSRRAAALAEHSARVHKTIRRETLDALGSISMFKALREERSAEELYAERLGEVEEVRAGVRRVGLLRAGVVETTVLLGAVIGEGLILMLVPGSPAGHLTRFCAFFLVAQQCLPDIQELSAYLLILVDQVPRLEALGRFFDDDGKFVVPSGHRPFTGLEERLEVRGLRFGYEPGVPVLRGLDATVPARRVTALVGPSGCGKTTFAELLIRLYDCEPGMILMDGTDIRDFDVQSLRARVHLAGHDPWILNRSLRENLSFGLDPQPDDARLWAALRDVELAVYFSGLPGGLDTVLGDDGVALSEGQRQRVALARVLLRDLDLLIMDEATSALDSALEERVWAAVLQRLAGRTILVISHRLSTVRMADHVLVMGSGGIVEVGSWEDLTSAGGHFAALFAAQLEAGVQAPGR